MFEKVNPSHPDKVADRIAGAVVDLAYKQSENPHIAVEVLIGHGVCHAIIETDTDICKEDVARAIARISGITVTDIIIVEQDKNLNANKEHPTMKPVALFDYQIKNNTKGGDLVLDLFGGSGTTIMACEQNGRNACVMEYDPKYVDVIIKRWEDFTGDKAVKITE